MQREITTSSFRLRCSYGLTHTDGSILFFCLFFFLFIATIDNNAEAIDSSSLPSDDISTPEYLSGDRCYFSVRAIQRNVV